MEKHAFTKLKTFIKDNFKLLVTIIIIVAVTSGSIGAFAIIKNSNNNTDVIINALGSKTVGTTNSIGQNNSIANSKNSQKNSVNSVETSKNSSVSSNKSIEKGNSFNSTKSENSIVESPINSEKSVQKDSLSNSTQSIISVTDSSVSSSQTANQIQNRKVVLNLNEESIYSTAEPIDKQQITVTLNKNYSLPVPKSDYYNFKGWFTSPINGEKLTNDQGESLNICDFEKEKLTVYAQWEKKVGVVIIKTVDDFLNINKNDIGVLVADLNLGEVKPIAEFEGEFNGLNHSITYTINSNSSNAGLFASCKGTIKNLTVNNSNLNCTTSGMNATGGLVVANLLGGGEINNCKVYTSTVNVTAKDKNDTEGSSRWAIAGGLVGKLDGGNIINCEVYNSFVTAYSFKHDKGYCVENTEVSYAYVGGLCGEIISGNVSGNKVSLNYALAKGEQRMNQIGERELQIELACGGVVGRAINDSTTLSDNQFLSDVSVLKTQSGGRNDFGLGGSIRDDWKFYYTNAVVALAN